MMDTQRFRQTDAPPEELGTQVPDKQCEAGSQLFTSLLRFGSGWFANQALPSGKVQWGAAVDTNIELASIKGVLSALNRLG